MSLDIDQELPPQFGQKSVDGLVLVAQGGNFSTVALLLPPEHVDCGPERHRLRCLELSVGHGLELPQQLETGSGLTELFLEVGDPSVPLVTFLNGRRTIATFPKGRPIGWDGGGEPVTGCL